MPPRFAYWTILIDDAPTAFRARDRTELLGVFRQLANRNPNAVMKWFAHGKLWDSPEQERAAARDAARAQREPRGPDWRPGGKHEDPRARFEKRRAERPHGRASGRDPRAGTSPRHGDQRRRLRRAAGAPAPKTSDTPSAPQPPAPPPGPERPPKPGQEPGPDIPAEETIKILPEPPERASKR
jgi:hypothetical protein